MNKISVYYINLSLAFFFFFLLRVAASNIAKELLHLLSSLKVFSKISVKEAFHLVSI